VEIDERAQPERPRPARRSPPGPGLKLAGRPAPLRTPSNTLDLRGERVEEALERVDAFIDRLMSDGEPAGFVLHGHGTGALKSAVRAHLEQSRWIERAEPAGPEDGGDAFTVFLIKS
jgi:DNA mismatch repair protein MutS2